MTKSEFFRICAEQPAERRLAVCMAFDQLRLQCSRGRSMYEIVLYRPRRLTDDRITALLAKFRCWLGEFLSEPRNEEPVPAESVLADAVAEPLVPADTATYSIAPLVWRVRLAVGALPNLRIAEGAAMLHVRVWGMLDCWHWDITFMMFDDSHSVVSPRESRQTLAEAMFIAESYYRGMLRRGLLKMQPATCKAAPPQLQYRELDLA